MTDIDASTHKKTWLFDTDPEPPVSTMVVTAEDDAIFWTRHDDGWCTGTDLEAYPWSYITSDTMVKVVWSPNTPSKGTND